MNNINLNELNELNVVNREYNLETGFFWVEFENGKSLQCCLVEQHQTDEERYKSGRSIYLEQVDINDNGFDYGLSWDNNQWAVGEDGEAEHIEEFLIEQAKQAGLEIIC